MSTAHILLLGAIAGATIFLGLPMGRLQGLGHVTETVLQLRGAYTGERQVPDAEVAAVAGGGSTACGAMLLRV